MGVSEVVAALIDEPWNGDDLLPPLSEADRAAVRAALLAKVADEDLVSGVPAGLGWFADAEVLEALKTVVRRKLRSDVTDAAIKSIGKLGLPAGTAFLRELVTHDDIKLAGAAAKTLEEGPAFWLPLIDAVAKRGDDGMMSAVIEQLAESATDPGVLDAFARHWNFAIVHGKTLTASNAIFDALIDHAPRSKQAQAVFAAALATEAEYAQVRGLAAMALTSDDITPHVKKLEALKGLKPSGVSLRSGALKKLVKTRKSDLERLAAAGDKTAAKLLK